MYEGYCSDVEKFVLEYWLIYLCKKEVFNGFHTSVWVYLFWERALVHKEVWVFFLMYLLKSILYTYDELSAIFEVYFKVFYS